MAKEITALNSTSERNGETRWKVFYHFPVSPRVQDANGTDIVPMAGARIPAEIEAGFTQAERDALHAEIDAGDRGVATRQVTQTPGETNADFAARLRLDWAATRDFKTQTWRDQYAHTGTQVDAP